MCIWGISLSSRIKNIILKGTAENIAKFIIQNYQYSTVIADNDGAIICRSVVGGYLDADNKEVMADILPYAST